MILCQPQTGHSTLFHFSPAEPHLQAPTCKCYAQPATDKVPTDLPQQHALLLAVSDPPMVHPTKTLRDALKTILFLHIPNQPLELNPHATQVAMQPLLVLYSVPASLRPLPLSRSKTYHSALFPHQVRCAQARSPAAARVVPRVLNSPSPSAVSPTPFHMARHGNHQPGHSMHTHSEPATLSLHSRQQNAGHKTLIAHSPGPSPLHAM